MSAIPAAIPVAIAVMARTPVLGEVKSRLANSIGDHAALEVYQWLLDRTLSICASSGLPVFVFLTDLESHDIASRSSTFSEFHYLSQQGDDLGVRMANAMADVHQHAKTVVMVGTDWPVLTKSDLFALCGAAHNGVAIKPADDGGYVALASGSKALWGENPLTGVNWGTASACADTCQALRDRGQTATILPSSFDLDDLDDLKRVGLFEQYYG